MSTFIVEGGHRLDGEITPQGAKNEALQILCATLLTPDKVTVENIPDILDINNLISMLCEMGVKVEKISPNTYSFQASDINLDYITTPEYIKKSASLRGSVMFVGPMVARFGYAVLPKPGG